MKKQMTIQDIVRRKKEFYDSLSDEMLFFEYYEDLYGYYHIAQPHDIPNTWLAKWLYVFDLTCAEFAVYSGLREQTIKDLRAGRLYLKESLKQEFMRIFLDLHRGRTPAPCKKHAEKSGKIVQEKIQLSEILKKDGQRFVYATGFDFVVEEKFNALEKELSLTW